MSERGTHVVGELAATDPRSREGPAIRRIVGKLARTKKLGKLAATDPRSREEIAICYM